MKIGILTYHRAHNYGALLQAIALRKVLEKMGHDAYYVDYWPKYHRSRYVFFSFLQLRFGLHRYLIHRLINFKPIWRRINCFKRDIAEYIEPYCDKEGKYDVIVYGSDQIWKRQLEIGSYNPVYFGCNGFSARCHFSYAASMGIIDPSTKEITEIQKWLSRFKSIGVRELDLQKFLKDQGITAHLNADPTLLLNADDWDKIFKIERKIEGHYLFYYNLNENTFNREAMNQYAQKRNLKIIELFGNARQESKYSFSAKILSDFISYIKYADVVFSTSYHGMVFSLIFNKNVYVSFKSNSQRAKTLLDYLNIGDCLIPPKTELYSEISIDYVAVNQKLMELRKESTNYLIENLNF
jgi:hypothetical protein